MYTSDTDHINGKALPIMQERSPDSLKTGVIYLGVSIIIAAAAAVYGLFGHGVYSYYMIYAFMIPLLGGAVPHLIAALIGTAKCIREKSLPLGLTLTEVQIAVISTLTVGCLLKGALDIYGTTNRLLIAYPLTAGIIAVLAAAMIKNKK